MARIRTGVLLAAAAAGVTLFAVSTMDKSAEVRATGNANGVKGFGIADVPGRSATLFPGATAARWIRLSNPQNFPIVVRAVSATARPPVDTAGRPATGCPANSVSVGALPSPVTVPGNGSTDVALPTSMRPTAPDQCRNLIFPLTYTGTATKP